MEKQIDITKNVYFECVPPSQVPNRKKCKQSTFCMERKRDFQEHVFGVFMSVLGTKTLMSMERTVCEKIKNFQISFHCFELKTE